MDMRDKFEALYAAKMSEQTGNVAPAKAMKDRRYGEEYALDSFVLPAMSGAWLGFQLAAAAVKRGEDIQ